MGVLWEVVQTGLMYGQKRKSDSIEDRVKALEDQLEMTQNTLRSLVKEIEKLHGIDIDHDGRVG
jgi:chaperonin cofactor prefoldin